MTSLSTIMTLGINCRRMILDIQIQNCFEPHVTMEEECFPGSERTWFLHEKAGLLLNDCNRPCLPKYVASKVGDYLNSKGFATRIAAIKDSVTDEPTHSSSKVVSVLSGIIHRYISNLNEDCCPASLTSSVTSRVVKSWPEELLKTKAADFGQRRHELNKLKSENALSQLVYTILPFEHGAADPISALQIEIKACLNRMQQALAQFKKLGGLSASDMSTVQVCQEEYESAVDDLNGATDAIVAHDVGTIQTRLSGVITYLGTCDDAVAESPGFKLPFKDEDVVTLRKLASNCMAISTLLL
ncbi:hypothetical protein D8674_022942 [Pyrus ussuriensis x Pyrus communis]|uniref:Pectinesterase inhibitor domain-containing protein n=1 Tax=Pyrus ussuriensis x Pyrus communis TaxID=2448454 RepID=A0A5N5GZZ4_9ROSA|nr:hypothetical protein D8674_022942 [Pyrus ussuriensis x Pyrus communis]